MVINYDPDGRPVIDGGLVRQAKEAGMQIVFVVCDEPEAKVGDDMGVSFAAVVPFLPRPGDMIWLEDGTKCQVRQVIFKAMTRRDARGKAECVLLVPNVDAIRCR
jgi:hypothetical protein